MRERERERDERTRDEREESAQEQAWQAPADSRRKLNNSDKIMVNDRAGPARHESPVLPPLGSVSQG